MAEADASRPPPWMWALLAFVLVLAPVSALRDLYDPDEGRYAAVAQAMAHSGDWVVPRLQGMVFADKPPLVYWIQAAVGSAIGHGPVSARAPTLLAGAVWCVLLLLLTWEWTHDRRTAWTAAWLGVSCTALTIGARVGPQMDMPLAACVAGAIYAVTRMLQGAGYGARIGLGLAVGLGLLAKGPLVVALLLLVALAWALAGVHVRHLLGIATSPTAWLVALAVAAPWYVAVERARPGWIEHFIGYEHLGRFTAGDHRSFHPFWFYVPVLLLYLVPWTPWLFTPDTDERGWRRWLWALPITSRPFELRLTRTLPVGRNGGNVALGRLAFAWFAAAFLLYSASSRKLLLYLLPALLPVVALCGARLAQGGRQALERAAWLPVLLGVAGWAVAAGIALGLILPLSTGRLPSAIEVPRHAPMVPWLVLAGALMLGVGLVMRRAQAPASRAALAWIFGLALCAWGSTEYAMARVAHLGSARSLAQAIVGRVAQGDPLVSLSRLPQGLSLYGVHAVQVAGGQPGAFRQREIVEPFATQHWQQQQQLAAPERWRQSGLLTDDEFSSLWAGSQRVWLVCRWAEVATLRGYIASGPHAGAGRTDLYLVTNLPLETR